MLTNAAADRREPGVGVIASAEDKAALALAVAVNCERVMIAAGSGIYQGCDAPLCLAAAVAGKLLGRSAPDESLSAAAAGGAGSVFSHSDRTGDRSISSGAAWCRRSGWGTGRSASRG